MSFCNRVFVYVQEVGIFSSLLTIFKNRSTPPWAAFNQAEGRTRSRLLKYAFFFKIFVQEVCGIPLTMNHLAVQLWLALFSKLIQFTKPFLWFRVWIISLLRGERNRQSNFLSPYFFTQVFYLLANFFGRFSLLPDFLLPLQISPFILFDTKLQHFDSIRKHTTLVIFIIAQVPPLIKDTPSLELSYKSAIASD